MSTNYHWTCPYCERDTTITESNLTKYGNSFDDGNKDGALFIEFTSTTCPNQHCKEYAITASLFKYSSDFRRKTGNALTTWQLRPASKAKVFPNFVPKPILDDYTEACLIRDLSPKASATLSRRCLQGIIRDFWGISKDRLYDEITEIKTKVDIATWKAIDAVRSIGNIGAHMEKDINIVIDVDPQEAQLLIELIEMLIKEWYIARKTRELSLAKIVAIADSKKVTI